MPGQVAWPDDILAEAPRRPRQAGGLQVESLSCLHSKLGAAAVPQGQAMGALNQKNQKKKTKHHFLSQGNVCGNVYQY